jgi:tetratricopeptide (TPR) repeat protein
MALTNCKECKQEVSAEAKTCPYCGIDNPGVSNRVIDNNNRRMGVVVLVLLIFLWTYILTRHEKADYQYTENAGISENKKADVAKVDQEANATQSSSQAKLMEVPTKEAITPLQQSSVQTTPRLPVNQEPPKQKAFELDKTKNISSADTPQMMVMRMLEYALNDGGLSRESEIQQTKLQIESTPKPAKGNNKKVARAINAKGLVSSKKSDFNNAVKMFEEANKLAKSDIEIVNNLGFSYLKQGKFDSAQQAIIIALTMSPSRATAWENLGEVFVG